ncbi:GTP cyclohydrolase FolE2 [Pectinatus frisingensis]|uniref:GTP cyclohydrolase FolE2 n=1 Tax=Pectinatus frisingensis TaxID=865 RepID=UPI003D804C7D
MKDVQNMGDTRGIAIQRVGISQAWLPFLIANKKKTDKPQHVTAKVKRFTVDLPMEYKGTHMSRFMEILHEYANKPLEFSTVDNLLTESLTKLSAKSAHIAVGFKYFVKKTAPISHKKSLLDVDCSFIGDKEKDGVLSFTIVVSVPVTSLCPCSKEISKYGAHNQRSIVKVKVKSYQPNSLTIEQLVKLIENQASSSVYSILKREDEKYVTETAYENPKFVEDMLRDLVLSMRKLKDVDYFSIECENFESIHNHNAYASHKEYMDRE